MSSEAQKIQDGVPLSAFERSKEQGRIVGNITIQPDQVFSDDSLEEILIDFDVNSATVLENQRTPRGSSMPVLPAEQMMKVVMSYDGSAIQPLT